MIILRSTTGSSSRRIKSSEDKKNDDDDSVAGEYDSVGDGYDDDEGYEDGVED